MCELTRQREIGKEGGDFPSLLKSTCQGPGIYKEWNVLGKNDL